MNDIRGHWLDGHKATFPLATVRVSTLGRVHLFPITVHYVSPS